jgi:NTE family protein
MNTIKFNSNEKVAIVCSGGGALGAFQAGVLKTMIPILASKNLLPQIFSGVSIGSINSAYCAINSGNLTSSLDELEDLWMSFHHPEFQINIKNAFKSALVLSPIRNKSFLNPQALNDIVSKVYNREKLESAFKAGTTLGVSCATTNYTTSKATWHAEGSQALAWNRAHSESIIEKLTQNHIIASCSIPVIFPPIKIGEHYF